MSYAQVYNREIQKNCCLAFKVVTHKFHSCWHSHREFEIVYIESGVGYLQFGQQQKKYKQGDIFLLGPWVPHEFIEKSKNHVSISLLFNHDFITPGFLNSDLASGIKSFLEKTSYGMLLRQDVLPIEIEMIKSVLSTSGLEKAINLLFLLKMLAKHNTVNLLSENKLIPFHAKKQFKVQDILHFINTNASKRLSLEEVASHFYMSKAHFSRFFREQSGTTFSQYLTLQRINKACELLLNTSLPITQISLKIGFDTISSFNRHFMKIKGCSPRNFRLIH